MDAQTWRLLIWVLVFTTACNSVAIAILAVT